MEDKQLKEFLVSKLESLSSIKIYNHVKDLYDIYVITSLYEFDLHELVNDITELKFEHVEILSDTLDRDILERNYSKLDFKNDYPKPDFDEVFCRVRLFVYPIYKLLKGESFKESHWDTKIWR